METIYEVPKVQKPENNVPIYDVPKPIYDVPNPPKPVQDGERLLFTNFDITMDSVPPSTTPPPPPIEYQLGEPKVCNWRRALKFVTVEPTMMLYMMAFMITHVYEQSYYVYKACTANCKFNETVCRNLNEYPEQNAIVQSVVSTFHQWNGVASHLPTVFMAFFLGAYSDKFGRRYIILAGLFGKLYFSNVLTLTSLFSDWPIEYIIYFASLPCAFTGSDMAIFAGCFAHLADVSSEKHRTLRITILDGLYLATMPTGILLGKVLWERVAKFDYGIIFLFNIAFMMVAVMYTYLRIETDYRSRTSLRDCLKLEHIKQTIETLGKRRKFYGTSIMWLLFLGMSFYVFQRDERPIVYLYTTNTLKWNDSIFSEFKMVASFLYVLVLLLGVPLMSKVFKIRDTVIVMMGATSHILGHFIYANATDTKYMYAGAVFSALGPAIPPIIRAMLSKHLELNERGVAYMFMSMLENVIGMVASVAYTQIYNYTNKSNAFLYMTITSQILVFVFIIIVHNLQNLKTRNGIVSVSFSRISC